MLGRLERGQSGSSDRRFVDELDLAGLGFNGVEPEATGRPSYHPSVLLKLYIYGYLNRVQSSRRLEREAGRNVEVMWLTGRWAPDHKTIADFRKDNGRAIRQVCARFVALCRMMGLLTQASVAIDGSKFKAVNNRDKNFTRAKMDRRMAQIEESVARYLQQRDTADRQEPSETLKTKTSRLKEKIAKLKEQMQRLEVLKVQMLATLDQQISLADPDSRSMATSGRGSGVVGYNVQVAVATAQQGLQYNPTPPGCCQVTDSGQPTKNLSGRSRKKPSEFCAARFPHLRLPAEIDTNPLPDNIRIRVHGSSFSKPELYNSRLLYRQRHTTC
jgi:transposase